MKGVCLPTSKVGTRSEFTNFKPSKKSLTDQHSYHPPPKKLLFAANGDTTENHTWTRDRQRFAGLLEPVETPAASPASMVQGMRRKRWCDVCKSQSTRESAVRLSSLERAAQRPEQRRYSQTC
ncbi:hypothetical protein LEMLEM_LOCUS795 [Lemmus lemmus]